MYIETGLTINSISIQILTELSIDQHKIKAYMKQNDLVIYPKLKEVTMASY